MEKLLALVGITLVLLALASNSEAARFRHPLTVPDMQSFAAPMGGNYFVGAAGTPDRYDLVNRYAYRLGNQPDSAEKMPEAIAEPLTASEPVVNRRSDMYSRRLRRERELNALYEKIAREFPFLVQQGLYAPAGEKPSLDHLLGMTIFGQPKMGRK